VQGEQGFYLVGLELSGILKAKFRQLIGEHEAQPQEVEVVMGRKLKVYSLCMACSLEVLKAITDVIF